MSINVGDLAGHPILQGRRPNVRASKHGLTSDQAVDDRYVDDGGNTSWPGGFVGGEHWTLCTLHVNYRDVNPAYGQVSVDVNLDDPIVIRLPNAGSGTTLTDVPGPNGATGYGTNQEWKTLAHGIVSRLGLSVMEPLGGAQPNLVAFDAELKKIHPWCELQFDSGGGKKPRIFMPTSDRSENVASGKYSRIVDIGDFGRAFFHDNAGHTDVWQLTPPSWG